MSRRIAATGALLLGAALFGVGCGGGGDDDDGDGPDAGDGASETTLFPADYDATFVEVRDCRKSADHDLNNIRIVADPTALSTYQDRDGDFPDGSIVLKEEYDFADQDCTGDIIQWTVMVKGDAESSAETLGWHWQQVGATREVETENELRCINCHTDCGAPGIGYQGTCAEP